MTLIIPATFSPGANRFVVSPLRDRGFSNVISFGEHQIQISVE